MTADVVTPRVGLLGLPSAPVRVLRATRSKVVYAYDDHDPPLVIRRWANRGATFASRVRSLLGALDDLCVPSDVLPGWPTPCAVDCGSVLTLHRRVDGVSPPLAAVLSEAGTARLATSLARFHQLPHEVALGDGDAPIPVTFTARRSTLARLAAELAVADRPWAGLARADLSELVGFLADGGAATLAPVVVHGDVRRSNLAGCGVLLDYEHCSVLPRLVDLTGPLAHGVVVEHGHDAAIRWLHHLAAAYDAAADQPLSNLEWTLLARFARWNYVFHGVGMWVWHRARARAGDDAAGAAVRLKEDELALFYGS